MPYDSIK